MTIAMAPAHSREVLVDARGDALRATWHAEPRAVQLSMWRDGFCRATFALSTDDAARLSVLLTASLAEAAAIPAVTQRGSAPGWRARLARWSRHLGR